MAHERRPRGSAREWVVDRAAYGTEFVDSASPRALPVDCRLSTRVERHAGTENERTVRAEAGDPPGHPARRKTEADQVTAVVSGVGRRCAGQSGGIPRKAVVRW